MDFVNCTHVGLVLNMYRSDLCEPAQQCFCHVVLDSLLCEASCDASDILACNTGECSERQHQAGERFANKGAKCPVGVGLRQTVVQASNSSWGYQNVTVSRKHHDL